MTSRRAFRLLGLVCGAMALVMTTTAVPIVGTSVVAGDPAAPNATFDVLVSVSDSPATGSVESIVFKVMYDSRKVELVDAAFVDPGFGGNMGPMILAPGAGSPVPAPADPSPDAFRNVFAADLAATNTLTNGSLVLLTFATLDWPSAPLNIRLGNPDPAHMGADPEPPLVYQVLGDDADLRPEYAPIFDNLDTIDIGAPDIDGDRIPDFAELFAPGPGKTNVYIADSDGDGILDADEFDLGTNPRDRDTDDDGLYDGFEILLGTDPINYQNIVVDIDQDGHPEAVSDDDDNPIDLAAMLNGADPDDASIDADSDGWLDGYEGIYFADGSAADDDAQIPRLGNPNDRDGINPTDSLLCLLIFADNIDIKNPQIVDSQTFDMNLDGLINPNDSLIMLLRFAGFESAETLPFIVRP